MRLLFFSFFIAAFSQVFAQQKVIEINYPDTSISYDLLYKSTDSLSSNKLKAYFASDTSILAYEKNFFYGKQNGLYKEFYPSGSLYLFCIYQQGKIHGDWTQYDEFGKILIKAKYINGIKHGFFIDKTAHFQGRYKDGKRHGKWEYNLNSLNYYKRFYQDGELVGKRKLNLIPKLNSKNNGENEGKQAEVIQVWEEAQVDTVQIDYPSDTILYAVRYLNRDSLGHPTMRKAVYRDSIGNTAIIKYIYGGKLSGNYKIYFPNGLLYKHLFYNYGVLNGAFKQYNEEGKLILLGNYKAGKKHGKWKYNLGEKNYFYEVFKNGKTVKKSKPN